MGQCVLNDHLRKQPCKCGSEIKKEKKTRMCFDSSSVHCFCKSMINESPKCEAINFINQQQSRACRSIEQSKHTDVEQRRAPRFPTILILIVFLCLSCLHFFYHGVAYCSDVYANERG